MNKIPEIGSVWLDKDNAHYTATIVWADDKTVAYDYSIRADDLGRHISYMPTFVKYYTPKPRTITVAGVELPEPIREAPNNGEMYWVVDSLRKTGVYQDVWTGSLFDLRRLQRGNAFRTKEEAQAWLEFEVKQRGGEL